MNNVVVAAAFAILLVAAAFFTLNPLTFILLLLALGVVLLLSDTHIALVTPQAAFDPDVEAAAVVDNAKDVGFEPTPVDARPTQDDNAAKLADNVRRIDNGALDERQARATALTLPRVETPISLEEIGMHNSNMARRGQELSEHKAMTLRNEQRTRAADPRRVLGANALHSRHHGQLLFLEGERDEYEALGEVRLRDRAGPVGRGAFAQG